MKSTYRRQYEEFLARLKRARKDAGLTQQELATRLRQPQSFVSKYENAERRLDVIEFVEVAQALGIDAGEAVTVLSEALAPRRNK